MLKNILNLNGAQELSKNEQKSIHGGGPLQGSGCQHECYYDPCGPYETCVSSWCGGGGNQVLIWHCVSNNGDK